MTTLDSMNSEISDFWQSHRENLQVIPLEISLEVDSFYSQPEWTVYRMRYTGLGGYRLFAWLSVPLAGGTYPALIRMPDYGSVHDIVYTSLRSQAIVMNPTYRGQRNSDVPFQAEYPGLLTEGIETPETYVMRQVFADALRAVHALLTQQVATVSALTITGAGLGGSLALAVASQCPTVMAVAADVPLMLGHPDILGEATAYPLGELNDYLRVYPHRRGTVLADTSPLNPLSIAAKVYVPVLLSIGTRDRGQCPVAMGEELAKRIPQCDLHIYDGAGEGGGHPHNVVRGSWLKGMLGLN